MDQDLNSQSYYQHYPVHPNSYTVQYSVPSQLIHSPTQGVLAGGEVGWRMSVVGVDTGIPLSPGRASMLVSVSDFITTQMLSFVLYTECEATSCSASRVPDLFCLTVFMLDNISWTSLRGVQDKHDKISGRQGGVWGGRTDVRTKERAIVKRKRLVTLGEYVKGTSARN